MFPTSLSEALGETFKQFGAACALRARTSLEDVFAKYPWFATAAAASKPLANGLAWPTKMFPHSEDDEGRSGMISFSCDVLSAHGLDRHPFKRKLDLDAFMEARALEPALNVGQARVGFLECCKKYSPRGACVQFALNQAAAFETYLNELEDNMVLAAKVPSQRVYGSLLYERYQAAEKIAAFMANYYSELNKLADVCATLAKEPQLDFGALLSPKFQDKAILDKAIFKGVQLVSCSVSVFAHA